MLAVNAPCIKPLLSPKSWLKSHRSCSSNGVVELGDHSQTIGSKAFNSRSGRISKGVEPGISKLESNDIESAKSVEEVIERNNEIMTGRNTGLEIHQTTTIEVGDAAQSDIRGTGRRVSETTCTRA